MMRLIGFFAVVWLVHRVLLVVPGVGDFLGRSSFFGYWAVAILVSLLGSRLVSARVASSRIKRRRSELLATDTPNNRGKVGLLELKLGHPKRAIEHLSIAFEHQPNVGDWALGLGLAHLELRDYQKAGECFARVVTDDPNMGFGQPFLGLARCAIGVGRPQDALGPLDEFEQRFGPAPEAAFWRGVTYKRLGRKAEAQAAFQKARAVASELPSFQSGRRWRMVWRSLIAQYF